MTLTTGHLLAERYRLGRRIAVGGMGEVWEADDTRLDRRVAVKVLKPELSGDDEFTTRFRVEARTTASLNHPGIAAVHDYGETATGPGPEADTAYLVMELVAGEPLSTILHRERRLSPERTLDIVGQAATALDVAHQRGLVHRDVKPANILITPAGAVKLTDFGIAKAVDAAPVTRAGMVMGTAHYLAPEQATGGEAGPASDVYSLGVVAYECLAGQRPFAADSAVSVAMMHIRHTPPPLPPDVPNGVRSLVEATLVKDPRQRYRTGGELAAAVAAVRAGRPLPVPGGMAGTAATELLAGEYPQTALLPPGALTSQYPSAPSSQYPAAPPTRSRPYPPPREERRRGGTILTMVLLVGVLALGVYALSGVLDSQGDQPGVTDAPVPPDEETTEEEPTPEETAPEETAPAEPVPPTETTEEEQEPTISDIDYLGDTGTEAAAKLTDAGYVPLVVGFGDTELDADAQDECSVVDVDPDGAVAPGETITVRCLG